MAENSFLCEDPFGSFLLQSILELLNKQYKKLSVLLWQKFERQYLRFDLLYLISRVSLIGINDETEKHGRIVFRKLTL